MQMNESREISAPPDVVWAALFDPEVLKQCVPGCEELTGSAETGFEAVVVQKVGPVKARFSGTIQITDVAEGTSATLSGEGKGGAAGFARGAARVRVEPTTDGTLLSYDVDAKVGGKLAQLGSRIIDGFARKMADQFFDRFKAAIEGPDVASEGDDSEGDGDGGDGKGKGWMRRLMRR